MMSSKMRQDCSPNIYLIEFIQESLVCGDSSESCGFATRVEAYVFRPF